VPQKPTGKGREKGTRPILKADAETTAGKERRLPVIAHYNYTLRLRSCGLSRED